MKDELMTFQKRAVEHLRRDCANAQNYKCNSTICRVIPNGNLNGSFFGLDARNTVLLTSF